MRTQRFSALVAAAPGGRAIIVVPFDPDEVWGAKAEHLDATTRRPDVRAARIAEVVDLLAAGVKERSKS
ncbi:MAG TPA: hypothetical protein VF223_11440 [Trebonia sp.]